jgi:TRAP-type C4-dicarboxylate transport system permease small subunit
MADSKGDDEPEVPAPRVAAGAQYIPSFPLIRKIDDAWFRVERAVCAVLFLAMGLLVFAAVVKETFGVRKAWIDVVILFGVCLLGVRTRAVKEGERRLGWPMSLGIAAALTLAVIGALYLYLRSTASGGMIWAQKLTLVLMVWVALLGASLATYERSHLALEMGEKLWPKRWLRYVKALAHGIAAAFCVVCCILAVYLVQQNADQGTLIEDNRWLSRWQALLVMPYAFGAMAIRFLAQSVTVATGTAAPDEDRLPT